jgi:DNA-binding transcriptional regulator YiaG
MSSTESKSSQNAESLAIESFMSAEDLHKYMASKRAAEASKALNAMDKADQARRELIEELRKLVDLTPQKIAEIKHNVSIKTVAAAERGDTEVMVMRFPSALCTDSGRAINNADPNWPSTLVGRPRQAFEIWKEHLQPLKYSLKAMIVEFPGGMPGDVGFFLSWG